MSPEREKGDPQIEQILREELEKRDRKGERVCLRVCMCVVSKCLTCHSSFGGLSVGARAPGLAGFAVGTAHICVYTR